ncbi:hypothetical protein [Escherichia coli]|uniref:hypothetical protein n=1 Tax=Escherichia coli TaxID=562 RepID=UPI00101FD351|nr:hypothetical protein [Escherichia coli]
MSQFKFTELHAISEKPQNDDAAWLIEAERSIKFLKENAQNDEVVIYAIGNSVLRKVRISRSFLPKLTR